MIDKPIELNIKLSYGQALVLFNQLKGQLDFHFDRDRARREGSSGEFEK